MVRHDDVRATRDGTLYRLGRGVERHQDTSDTSGRIPADQPNPVPRFGPRWIELLLKHADQRPDGHRRIRAHRYPPPPPAGLERPTPSDTRLL